MKYYNKNKTIMVETNSIEFYRFTPEEPGRPPDRLETLELQMWGGQKNLFGADARELYEILIARQNLGFVDEMGLDYKDET
jgi:hypothetical protein